MKLFVSQPMHDRSEEEILAEREVLLAYVKSLRKEDDIELIDSFFQETPEGGNIPLAYLAKSIALLAQADLVIFANGWENARGCRVEHLCAEAYHVDYINL